MLSAFLPRVDCDSPERQQQQGRRNRGGVSPASRWGRGKAGVKGDWETAMDVWLPFLPSLSWETHLGTSLPFEISFHDSQHFHNTNALKSFFQK